MTETQKAARFIQQGLKQEKAADYAAAVDSFNKGLESLERAIRDEKYGETGRSVLEERKAQYVKRLEKLRAKLPDKEPVKFQVSSEVIPENVGRNIHQTVVETHPSQSTLYPRLPDDDVDGRVALPGMVGSTPEFSPRNDQARKEKASISQKQKQHVRDSIASLLTRMKPGEPDYKHLEAALQFHKKAEEADKDLHPIDALDLYQKALEFYSLSKDEISNELAISEITKGTDQIIERMEVLNKIAVHRVKKVDTSTSDNCEGIDSEDQATLERRPHVSRPSMDVIGLGTAKEVLTEALTRLESGGNDHYNILLVGSPGVGKSMLVNRMYEKASHVTVIYTPESKYNLNHQSDVIRVFDDARKQKPSMICIDDLDKLTQAKVTKQLLTELREDPERNKKIVFVCTTHCPWALDPELRESFDKVVFMPLPNKDEREEIAKGEMGHVNHNLTKSDFDAFAQLTEGYTGFDIDNVINGTIKEERTEEATNVEPSEVTYKNLIQSLQEVNKSVSASEDFRLRNWVFQTNKSPQEQTVLLQTKPEYDSDQDMLKEKEEAVSKSTDTDQIHAATKTENTNLTAAKVATTAIPEVAATANVPVKDDPENDEVKEDPIDGEILDMTEHFDKLEMTQEDIVKEDPKASTQGKDREADLNIQSPAKYPDALTGSGAMERIGDGVDPWELVESDNSNTQSSSPVGTDRQDAQKIPSVSVSEEDTKPEEEIPINDNQEKEEVISTRDEMALVDKDQVEDPCVPQPGESPEYIPLTEDSPCVDKPTVAESHSEEDVGEFALDKIVGDFVQKKVEHDIKGLFN